MRYIIININTKEPIKQRNDILFFKTYSSAKKYYEFSLKNDFNYQIQESPDIVSKKELAYIENEIKDIYHAIEYASSNEELLKLASILQTVLKKRRKIKNKLKGVKGNIQFITPYKNKTSILLD